MNEEVSHDPAVEDLPFSGLDDLTKRRIAPAVQEANAAIDDALHAMSVMRGDIDRILKDAIDRLHACGIDDKDWRWVRINFTIGNVCGMLLAKSGTPELAKTRAFALLAAVVDERRVGTVFHGLPYMFRLDPEYIRSFWPDADVDHVNFIARWLRSCTLETADLTRHDANAMKAVKLAIHVALDMLSAA